MKILIAPLNWGLGHATRCIPIIDFYLSRGDEVVLAGDGDSMTLLRKRYPHLRHVELPHLRLHYSKSNSQTLTLLRQLPHLIYWMIQDYYALQQLISMEMFDKVVSDNRFAFYSKQTTCVYLTHQLHICLPKRWRWLEPVAEAVHRTIMHHYAEVWVPDKEQEPSLAGVLSHPKRRLANVRYIGPISRFMSIETMPQADMSYHTVLLLSGLEPQRTCLEKAMVERYETMVETLLVVQGRPQAAYCKFTRKNVTVVPYMSDTQLLPYLLGAEKIIARSGYSSIMDFAALGVLSKCEFVPTPGQTEQEYLAEIHGTSCFFSF